MKAAMTRQAPVPDSDWMAATRLSAITGESSPSASLMALSTNGL